MTIRQKQWQLYYLGFLNSRKEIDGIWGARSAAATKAFQQTFGLRVDGIFGPLTREKSREVVVALQKAVGAQTDGLAGTYTVAATAVWQQSRGLPPLGIADADTRDRIQNESEETPEQESWWDSIEYFSREEFRCKCGGRYCSGFPAEMRREVVQVADRARRHFGSPGCVVSGLRCRQHNANSGGVANSQHMYGEAVDLCIRGVSADSLLHYIRQQPEIRYAYKINSTNVHFDIPKGVR